MGLGRINKQHALSPTAILIIIAGVYFGTARILFLELSKSGGEPLLFNKEGRTTDSKFDSSGC